EIEPPGAGLEPRPQALGPLLGATRQALKPALGSVERPLDRSREAAGAVSAGLPPEGLRQGRRHDSGHDAPAEKDAKDHRLLLVARVSRGLDEIGRAGVGRVFTFIRTARRRADRFWSHGERAHNTPSLPQRPEPRRPSQWWPDRAGRRRRAGWP